MPPRRETTLSQIEQRLGAIEQRLATLETGPHNGCPSEVLKQRIANLEQWQARQNGSLQKIEERLETSRTERQKQIDGLQKQVSDNHTETIASLGLRDRQVLIALGSAVFAAASAILMLVLRWTMGG